MSDEGSGRDAEPATNAEMRKYVETVRHRSYLLPHECEKVFARLRKAEARVRELERKAGRRK